MNKMNEKQLKELLNTAIEAKEKGETLVGVFKKIAQKYGLSAGSVRNIYYKQIKRGKCEKLSARKAVPFSKEEEKQMLRKILLEKRYTSSMREVFLKIANGNSQLAMRYQNKFCNMLKKERVAVMREIILQKKIMGECYNPYLTQEQKRKSAKLKKEIDQLVKSICEKCQKENELLRKKIALYQKICGSFSFEESVDKKDYFKQSEKIANGKAT